jgi:hypothetical protein
MVSIVSLWLPILLSAVGVFLVSSLIHMVLKYHHADFGGVPDERGVMDALRPFAIPPGDYAFPRASGQKEMATPEFQTRLAAGPVAFMTVLPSGPFSMGASLVQWFLYSVVVGVFAAYVAGQALPAGAHYLKVFQFTGAMAFACYAVAGWQNSIWYRRSWLTTAKNTFDGLVYALVTAGFFGWLWPAA